MKIKTKETPQTLSTFTIEKLDFVTLGIIYLKMNDMINQFLYVLHNLYIIVF